MTNTNKVTPVESTASAIKEKSKKRDWKIFIASIFFVLGFSVIFSVLGILLQTILSRSSTSVQSWLGRIGGIIIIFFGLYIVGLIHPKFMMQEHKINVQKQLKKSKSLYLTSFVFGAAFAVGWTPCVSAALGAILGLAATQPSSAFVLLMSYTLGLGLPFLLVGLFTNEAQKFVKNSGRWIKYVNYIFGTLLIIIGVLVFTQQLSRIANLEFVVSILTSLNIGSVGSEIAGFSIFNIVVSFIAGLISFLSPCVLPLIPAFLTYLGSVGAKHANKDAK